MFTYLFSRFLRRVFSLLWADGLYFIYSSGLKVWILLVQDTFHLLPVISAVVSIYLITSTTVPQILVLVLRPEFGARFAPSIHDDLCYKTNFPYPYYCCQKWGYFRFRILANHLAFFFLSLVTECKHLLAFTLTHILYFLQQAVRNRPILLFLFLAVSRNTLFLFSQWEKMPLIRFEECLNLTL